MTNGVIVTCKKCGSANIKQQVTAMVDPNDAYPFAETLDYHWDDFFWCVPCDEQCHTQEVTEDEDS